MNLIRNNGTFVLAEGYSEFAVESDDDLSLSFEASVKAEVFIRIRKAVKVNIETSTKPGGEVTYLFWNETHTPTVFNEVHTVAGNASLKIAYAEIEQADTERKLSVSLIGEGASADVNSAVLTGVKKHFVMNVSSLAPHTIGVIRNFSVVLEKGSYHMEATGEIIKGAYASESHQESRALCFDDGIDTKILPILLIDENDVKASHATSLGRVDEEQLYYMQSRGLTPKQCTGLISTGYLMPVTEAISDEKLRMALREEMERKISELCSM